MFLFFICCYDLAPSAWILIEQAFKNPPFRISEQGWGEFDMQIILTAADKDHTVTHDLNFAQPRYESKHVLVRIPIFPWKNRDKRLIAKKKQTFKNPKPALLAALRESGPVPGDENGMKAKRAAGGDESLKKKKRTEKNVPLSPPYLVSLP